MFERWAGVVSKSLVPCALLLVGGGVHGPSITVADQTVPLIDCLSCFSPKQSKPSFQTIRTIPKQSISKMILILKDFYHHDRNFYESLRISTIIIKIDINPVEFRSSSSDLLWISNDFYHHDQTGYKSLKMSIIINHLCLWNNLVCSAACGWQGAWTRHYSWLLRK